MFQSRNQTKYEVATTIGAQRNIILLNLTNLSVQPGEEILLVLNLSFANDDQILTAVDLCIYDAECSRTSPDLVTARPLSTDDGNYNPQTFNHSLDSHVQYGCGPGAAFLVNPAQELTQESLNFTCGWNGEWSPGVPTVFPNCTCKQPG